VAFGIWLTLGASRALSPLVGLSFAFAILPTVRLEREGRFVVPSWLLLLGAASYAIYLTHGLVISAIARVAHSLPLIIAFGIVTSVAGGLIYYFCIERPLLKLGSPSPRFRNADRVGGTT
jgi:peptidoglycan/LPS O-acetylase OafA/YrhL